MNRPGAPCWAWAIEQALLALPEAVRPHKVNLAQLGNVVPHVHWHVIGRREEDSHFPAPIWVAAQRPQPEALLAGPGGCPGGPGRRHRRLPGRLALTGRPAHRPTSIPFFLALTCRPAGHPQLETPPWPDWMPTPPPHQPGRAPGQPRAGSELRPRDLPHPLRAMRVHSPSAEVQGHGPGQETVQTGKREVQIVALEPVGHYAVKPTFLGWPRPGLFSWALLHEMGSDVAGSGAATRAAGAQQPRT